MPPLITSVRKWIFVTSRLEEVKLELENLEIRGLAFRIQMEDDMVQENLCNVCEASREVGVLGERGEIQQTLQAAENVRVRG